MIFATVGTQLPFDRLLQGLNNWAARNPIVPVFAQIGESKRSFSHIDTVDHLSQAEFLTRFSAARLIVSPAGLGTILSAADLGKPLILMPRRQMFHEHRNDHQLDTASEMKRLSNVTVVADDEALHETLDRALAQGLPTAHSGVETTSSKLEPLLNTIRDFVWEQPHAQRGEQ